ncbi:hypothetical protein BDW75DRAFT_244559 [Aspergillus navahoensis]
MSLSFIGTCPSSIFQTHIGRRAIYVTNLVAMLPLIVAVVLLGAAPQSSGVQWAQYAPPMIWFFCYGCTIGPLPYAVVAEIGASTLHNKTISLGRGTYHILSVLNSAASPFMLNPAEGDLKGIAALYPLPSLRLSADLGFLPAAGDKRHVYRDPASPFPSEGSCSEVQWLYLFA